MQTRLALFDMDGTILDTLQDLTDAVNAMMTRYGYPTHSMDAVRSFVGNGIPNLIRRALPVGTEEAKIHTVLGDFQKYYKENCAIATKPYEGITALLKHLRAAGVKLAVVSNKADPAVKALAEQYFKGLFHAAIGDREGIAKKPAPDSVFEVMRALEMPPEACVYIGDSDVDVKTAQNAGIRGIFVDWGFRSVDCLREAGAREIVSTPDALEQLLL